MSDAVVPTEETPRAPVERTEAKSEREWLDERRRERIESRREPDPEPQAEQEPSEEVEPEQEPEGDLEPVRETEDEADDATLDEELLAESEESDEPSEETDDVLSGTVTLSELAEGLDVTPEDLAEHVQVTVTPNGKAETVSLAELQKGYMREADYTRQKMALADNERDFETRSKAAIERHNASVQQLDAVAMMLAQEIDTGLSDEDLTRLKTEDPTRWAIENDNRNRKLQAFNHAIGQRKLLDDQRAEQTRKDLSEYRGKQQEILKQKMPDMADPQKVKAFETDVGGYLTTVGYSNKEVQDFFGGPWDARAILVLADAAKYRAQKSTESKAKKKIKKFPLRSKSKARRTQAQQSGDKMRSAKARLRAEGSTEAALDMLKERRRQRNASHGGSK